MPRLRTVSPSEPGWHRVRSGRGFRYLDSTGKPLGVDDVDRIRALVIPPAWKDVWISPHPHGHIQAVGVDARGRRQYLYHPTWRQQRDMAKHDRVLRIARKLPKARTVVARDLEQTELTESRALAAAFRLLDLGYFRMGSDTYVDDNGSYGLTTLRRRHVRRTGRTLVFDFPAKSGKQQHIEITDPAAARAVRDMLERRGPGTLMAWHDDLGWHSITPLQLNTYLRSLVGDEVSAKDFRTWHGTVHACVELAVRADVKGTSARRRAVASAVREVSQYLGNTPAVARSSYIDPRAVDQYLQGRTIATTLKHLRPTASGDQMRTAVERAVIALLRDA